MKLVNADIVSTLRPSLGQVVMVEGQMHLFVDYPDLFVCDSDEVIDPAREGVPIVDDDVRKVYFDVVPLREGGPVAVGRGRIVGTVVRSTNSPNGLAIDRVQSLAVDIDESRYDVTPAILANRAKRRA